ncbi:hypothetical protein DNTS_032190 [Danionella cerebrum]|uniref:Uncharacterized protein n=1 Tax=Danionella cerebrum TaxID=2873325 RepID=A0A553PUR6_9TELE|nr:hypothetical protein DNTS_032190 [Danionella translucida]
MTVILYVSSCGVRGCSAVAYRDSGSSPDISVNGLLALSLVMHILSEIVRVGSFWSCLTHLQCEDNDEEDGAVRRVLLKLQVLMD